MFAKLAGRQKFTKIDLRQAYHQMEVEEESQEYLTINTHQGLYRYNRLVFGITSAPAIWQRSVDQILEGVEGTSCILDDMIITGKDDKEHLENLEEVLKRLQANGLRANREKQIGTGYTRLKRKFIQLLMPQDQRMSSTSVHS